MKVIDIAQPSVGGLYSIATAVCGGGAGNRVPAKNLPKIRKKKGKIRGRWKQKIEKEGKNREEKAKIRKVHFAPPDREGWTGRRAGYADCQPLPNTSLHW